MPQVRWAAGVDYTHRLQESAEAARDIIVSNIVMGYFNGSLEGKMRWCLRASVYVSRELQDFAADGLGAYCVFLAVRGH